MVKRAYKQDAKRVTVWFNKEYSAFASKGEKEKAEIHWEDEKRPHNKASNAKKFAPKSLPSIIRFSAEQCRISMMLTVTDNGRFRFMLYPGEMTSAVRHPLVLHMLNNLDFYTQ
jgi:hypothetical protein